MGRIGQLRKSVEFWRAKARGMDVEEYRTHRMQLRETEKKERLDFEKWRVHEKYQQKRKRSRSSGGRGGGMLDKLFAIGENVNKNIERESRGSGGSLNAFFGEPTPRRKRKKKR